MLYTPYDNDRRIYERATFITPFFKNIYIIILYQI